MPIRSTHDLRAIWEHIRAIPFACAVLERRDELILLTTSSPARGQGPAIIYANECFLASTGYTIEDLIGRPLYLVEVADMPDAAALPRLIATPGKVKAPLRLRTNDGRELRLEASAIPVPLGPSTYLLISMRESPAEQGPWAQQQLTEQLLASAFLSIPAPAAVIDRHCRLVMANAALAGILKQALETLVDRPFSEFVAVEHHPALEDRFEIFWARGKPTSYDLTIKTGGDGCEAVAVSMVPFTLADRRKFAAATFKLQGEWRNPAGSRQNSATIAGKFEMIGLNEVRESLGERWVTARDRAIELTESVIRRRIRPADAYSRTADDAFVICFSDVTEEEAAFRAATIAQEIRQKLIGDGGAVSALKVGTLVGSIADLPNEPLPSLCELISERLEQRRQELVGKAKEEIRQALTEADTCRIEAIADREGRIVRAGYVRFQSETEDRLHRAGALLPEEPNIASDAAARLIELAATQILIDAATGNNRLYLMPIEFEIFGNRHLASRIVTVLKALVPSVGQNLVFLLRGIPRDTVHSRITDVLNYVRPFVRGTGFEMPLTSAVTFSFSRHRPAMIAVDFGEQAGSDRAERLRKLAGQLQAMRVRVLARGVATNADRATLEASGVELMSGPVIDKLWPGSLTPDS